MHTLQYTLYMNLCHRFCGNQKQVYKPEETDWIDWSNMNSQMHLFSSQAKKFLARNAKLSGKCVSNSLSVKHREPERSQQYMEHFDK